MRIRVVCKGSLDAVTPELLEGAIGRRLGAMIERYQPMDEEPAQAVMGRLRMTKEGRADDVVFRATYGADGASAVRIHRLVGRAFEHDRRDLFEELAGRDEPEIARLRELVTKSKEGVDLPLEGGDERSMGLAVAMAAAAALALAGDGVLRVDGEGWLELKGQELVTVLGEAG